MSLSTSDRANLIARKLESCVFAGRWLLIPMYVGLALVLLFYVGHYIAGLADLTWHFHSLTETDLMLAVLTAVDTVMLGNLLAFIMIGSYSIFVRPLEPKADAPGWLKHITSSTLKTKISTSLIGITSIHLLRDFIAEHGTEAMQRHLIIHGVFVISAIGLACTDWLSHSKRVDP